MTSFNARLKRAEVLFELAILFADLVEILAQLPELFLALVAAAQNVGGGAHLPLRARIQFLARHAL